MGERTLVLVLAAIQFTNIMDFMIMMPLGPQLMRVMLISPQQFGLLVSAYTLTAAVAALAVAFYTDRFDRRKALLFFYGGFVISTLLCGIAPGYGRCWPHARSPAPSAASRGRPYIPSSATRFPNNAGVRRPA